MQLVSTSINCSESLWYCPSSSYHACVMNYWSESVARSLMKMSFTWSHGWWQPAAAAHLELCCTVYDGINMEQRKVYSSWNLKRKSKNFYLTLFPLNIQHWMLGLYQQLELYSPHIMSTASIPQLCPDCKQRIPFKVKGELSPSQGERWVH